MDFKRIDPAQCQQLIANSNVTLLDIRDPHAYADGHINNALHIENIDVESFIENSDKTQPLVVYCYHGHSSLSAAAYFTEKGFTDVYSLDGGFDGWQQALR